MNTCILTLGLGLGGGREIGTSWEQIWQALWRLLREEYVKNESEYRNFKYLIPALILIHTFFIFQIKNLREFPISFILLLPWGTWRSLCQGPSLQHLGHKGSKDISCCLTTTLVTPAVKLAPFPILLWKATIVGFRVPEWCMGPDTISWPPACPRGPWNSEMIQPSCASKVLAQVLSWMHARYTLNWGLLQERGFCHTQPGGPSALTVVFILKLTNQFYRVPCHHKPVLTCMQGKSSLHHWKSNFCFNTCSQLLPRLYSGGAGEQTPRQ